MRRRRLRLRNIRGYLRLWVNSVSKNTTTETTITYKLRMWISDSIVVSDTLKYRYEYSFVDSIYKYRHVLMLASATIFIIIASLIYIILVNLKHSRKHREEATLMNIQKKRYQLLMDKSDDMIYEIGLEENSGVSSDKIKTIFGWTIPSKVEDLTFDTLMKVLHIHPDDVDKLYDDRH